MKVKPVKTCGYCGKSTGSWTRDHVVPSLLWGKTGLPDHPVIVPACDECRLLFDDDAEYFRNRLVAMVEPGSHAIADRIRNTTLKRSCDRRVSVSTDLTKNLRFVPAINSQGIYTGMATEAEIDIPRFTRIPEKIIRGIYFHYSQKVFPSSYNIRLFPPKAFSGQPFCESLIDSMCDWKHQGDDVFKCKYVRDRIDQDSSVWLLVFYQEIGFFVIAAPAGQPDVEGLVNKTYVGAPRTARIIL